MANTFRNRDAAIAQAREIILRHGWNSTVYQLLNPGMELWFSSHDDAVVGYVEASGFRVVAGAPVCRDDRFADVVNEFENDSSRARRKVCYFGAGQRLADVLARRGPLDRILLGAEPQWDPRSWDVVIKHKASLRAQLNRARNKGVAVAQWQAEQAQYHPELERCLAEWLETRGLPPLHFLVEPETLNRLFDRKIFVARRNGSVVGFLISSPIPMRNGWLVEQIIRGHQAPNGTNELLLDAAMRSLAESGVDIVTLGLSPLSQRAGFLPSDPSPIVGLLLSWARLHGRRFYNFEGLDTFKAKFMPESWAPIYAITNESRVTFATMYAIAGAFGGTSPVVFLVRSISRAIVQELRWLWNRLRRLWRQNA